MIIVVYPEPIEKADKTPFAFYRAGLREIEDERLPAPESRTQRRRLGCVLLLQADRLVPSVTRHPLKELTDPRAVECRVRHRAC